MSDGGFAGEIDEAQALDAAPWWQRDDLGYRGGRLHLGTTDLDALARLAIA